jgi:hypothetical protein
MRSRAQPTRLSTRRAWSRGRWKKRLNSFWRRRRVFEPAAHARRCAGCVCGAAAAGERRRQDFGALARSRDPRGYIRAADDHRRQVDHLSAHGRGLRGPRHHAGQAATTDCRTKNLRIHGYAWRTRRRWEAWRSTVPMRRRFARWLQDPALAAQLHPDCRTLLPKWCGRRGKRWRGRWKTCWRGTRGRCFLNARRRHRHGRAGGEAAGRGTGAR